MVGASSIFSGILLSITADPYFAAILNAFILSGFPVGSRLVQSASQLLAGPFLATRGDTYKRKGMLILLARKKTGGPAGKRALLLKTCTGEITTYPGDNQRFHPGYFYHLFHPFFCGVLLLHPRTRNGPGLPPGRKSPGLTCFPANFAAGFPARCCLGCGSTGWNRSRNGAAPGSWD
jgi:hypothetical protein